MAAGSDCSPPLLGTMAKMAPRSTPEMFAIFAIFAKFAIFDPALEYPTLIHRQDRFPDPSPNAPSRHHMPLLPVRKASGF